MIVPTGIATDTPTTPLTIPTSSLTREKTTTTTPKPPPII